MNVTLPRDMRLEHTWPALGSWALVRSAETGPTAFVGCLHCGKSASLSGHSIDTEGKVTPSLGCPTEGCNWHVFVTLEGWAEAIVK